MLISCRLQNPFLFNYNLVDFSFCLFLTWFYLQIYILHLLHLLQRARLLRQFFQRRRQELFNFNSFWKNRIFQSIHHLFQKLNKVIISNIFQFYLVDVEIMNFVMIRNFLKFFPFHSNNTDIELPFFHCFDFIMNSIDRKVRNNSPLIQSLHMRWKHAENSFSFWQKCFNNMAISFA